jgi:hypothetical protein
VGEDAGEEAEVLWFVGWVVGLIGVGGGGGAVGVGVGNVGGGGRSSSTSAIFVEL